ncbi:endonuclease/exonuclease/phosphatase family protein [Aliiroseovarius subalbicans]|uniref:endonuclease/exonuclease/phosphatase family protein n=1 Tax=Aliiroseovarius subalbicans TaxID=2925840 RepID=UPI001F573CE6|nr:endonuclease/exonuclease/phosphatase family protein [Aliiroseovarius subalbicans]MCI2398667.1 endonuclease/exonuclease/phosphatase family protein [Aliiroseovarius subalbicans]
MTYATVMGLVALVGGYLGALHPMGDSLAVLRPHLAAVLVLAALGLLAGRRPLLALVNLSAGAVALVPILWALGGADASPNGASLSLYQKNMLFRMPSPARLGQDILLHKPDFVTLQEVSGVNLALFDTLGDTYPAQQFCPFETIGGVAVASRWPVIRDTAFCAEHDGMAGMQVSTPEGPVWVVSIHLHWPWPNSQASQAARLLPVLATLDGPIAIGGDFNMVPWSHMMRDVAEASNTRRIGRPHVSLMKAGGWLRVPIDHVLVSGQGETQRLPLLGSDHFGILARFDLAW